ncbi:MAG: queuosine precursor transporter [bacterium]
MTKKLKLNLMLSLFSGLLVAVNLLGGKITTIVGVSVSVGIFMVPLTFLITDIAQEVYGKKVAGQFVTTGVITLIITFFYVLFFIKLPPNERYALNNEYAAIFGSSLRMIIASLVAFVLSGYHDVWAFEFWKRKTQGKKLWLRNNFSTIVSQGIDTFVFMMIAFYKIAPKFDFLFIIKLIIPYYIFKIVFALLDTPFVYLGVKWLKSGSDE